MYKEDGCPPAAGDGSGPFLKALIAEDNSGFRQILERMLTKWGYEVIAAESGFKAWEVLQATDPPRLAILDWNMPGLDGVEV